jgi:GT2 family glycosyltransferase
MKADMKDVKSYCIMREFRLDVNWYAEKYPNSVLGIQSGRFESLQEHFDSTSLRELCSPSPYFCSSFYVRQSKYRERRPSWGIVEDYFRYGAPNGIAPHWLFDEGYFLGLHPEARQVILAGNLVSGYQYYIRKIGIDNSIKRPSPLFNKNYYIKNIGRKVIRDPFYDFIMSGSPQGISCSPLFDINWYSSKYTELRRSVGNIGLFESYLQHFLEFGMNEGKTPIPDFDEEYYIKQNPDVFDGSSNNIKPIRHFLYQGISGGKSPNRFFDSKYYLENNPEAAKDLKKYDFIGPFEHFLAIGLEKNFKANRPLVSLSIAEDSAKAIYEKRCQIQAAAIKARVRSIRIPKFDNPYISIIIPVYNHFNFTINLLQQISLYIYSTHNEPCGSSHAEIIVVDNGSTDLTKEIEHYIPGITIVRHSSPLGYPKACNLGAEAAKGRVLLFVNNDIEIQPGSLERVVDLFGREPNIGAAGGKIIKLNCVLQEAGGIVWNDGSTWGYGRGENPLAPCFQFQRDVDYCSGCFLAVDAALFKRLGGFDEDFSPGYYEETDLCARIWNEGRRVIYDPRIEVYHYEYASFSKGRPETVATGLIAQNREKFLQKNKEFISRRPRFSLEQIEAAASRAEKIIPRVLFIEDILPRHEIGSGFCRSEDIVWEFLKAGWWVNIWVNQKLPSMEPIDAPFCEVTYACEQTGGLTKFLQKASKSIDIIWICRTHNICGYAEAISQWRADNPRGRVICDSEAIASVRNWLIMELAKGISPDLASVQDKIQLSHLQKELAGHHVVDAFVAVSEIDQQLIAKVASGPISILGHKILIRPTETPFGAREGLLFCGAVHDEDSPNYDSLMWFANKIAPLLRVRLPNVKLRIVGFWRPLIEIPPELNTGNIEFIGAVPDLAAYFASARLFVAPTRVAAGIPHKVHEAMGFGLPTVVTPILASQLVGFGSQNEPAFIAARDFSPEAFCDAITYAYSNPEIWERVRASAFKAIEQHCSTEGFSNGFARILETAVGDGK